jgi:hypothetical protein
MSGFDALGTSGFHGEVPAPGPIDRALIGISEYDAKADHSHDFFVDDWQLLPLTAPWADIGFGFRSTRIAVVGNMVVLRGTITGGPAGPSNIASLPTDLTPSETESFMNPGNRFDVQSNGLIVANAYAGAGSYISFSGCFWFLG